MIYKVIYATDIKDKDKIAKDIMFVEATDADNAKVVAKHAFKEMGLKRTTVETVYLAESTSRYVKLWTLPANPKKARKTSPIPRKRTTCNLNVIDYVKFWGGWPNEETTIYVSERCDYVQVGQVLFKPSEKAIGVIIQTFATGDFRTDMWGMSYMSEVEFATIEQVKKYRPDLVPEIWNCGK